MDETGKLRAQVWLRGSIVLVTAAAVVATVSLIGERRTSSAPQQATNGRGMTDEEIARRRGVDANLVKRLRKVRSLGTAELLGLPDERLREALRELDTPDE